MSDKMFFLEQNDPELEYAWSKFPDPVMRNEKYCESLQYMGTVITELGIHHEFRHRAVPGSNERKYWKIPARLSLSYRVKENEFKLF